MKKTLAFLSCLLLCICFVLTGCSHLAMPASDAKILGNGGSVVQKGEYIYFANAYTGYASLGDEISNKTGKAGVYGLYRVKSENGKLERDEHGMVKNAELIVSKVVGFEYSNLYIVGDYLYFSSPNMHKTSSNKNKYDLISIFKVKLDGTDLKELYTTDDFSGSWEILNFDSKYYVLTVEGENIVRHQIDNKGNLSDKTILADNVAKAILTNSTNYSNDKYVYFTCARSEEDTNVGLGGNYLKKVSILNGQTTTICGVAGETYALLAYEKGNLIYTKSSDSKDSYLYVNDFENAEKNVAVWSGVSNVRVATVMGQGLQLLYTYQSKVVIQSFDSMITDVLIDGNASIINIDEDYVYYTLDNKISRVSLLTKVSTDLYEDSNMATSFDFDGRYIYLFTQAKNNSTNTKYMHMIDTYALEQEVEVVANPMGVFKDKDKNYNED